jgi:hypothetical protein
MIQEEIDLAKRTGCFLYLSFQEFIIRSQVCEDCGAESVSFMPAVLRKTPRTAAPIAALVSRLKFIAALASKNGTRPSGSMSKSIP